MLTGGPSAFYAEKISLMENEYIVIIFYIEKLYVQVTLKDNCNYNDDILKEFKEKIGGHLQLEVKEYRIFNVINLRKYRKFNKNHLTIDKKLQLRYRY